MSPEDEAENQTYALTAYHVVPFKSANETRVITPGGWDILSILNRLLENRSRPMDHEELDFLLERWSKNVEKCDMAIWGPMEMVGAATGPWFA